MTFDRRSALVQLGRGVQRICGYCGLLDLPFQFFARRSCERREVPLVCVVAVPRSGSTLTYQVLSAGLQCAYLSNLRNLLYSTPVLAGQLSELLGRNYQSSFVSDHGLVPGLWGESEGHRFWHHWLGQGDTEEPDQLMETRVRDLSELIELAVPPHNAFVHGYLGHAFCIEMLRKVFPKILFVHLVRDVLSNAVSLLIRYPNAWASSKPSDWRRYQNLPRTQQVVEQVLSVHKRILRQTKGHNDTLRVSFESVCTSPRSFVANVCDYAAGIGIDLDPADAIAIPKEFNHRRRKPSESVDARIISNYVKARTKRLSDEEHGLFADIAEELEL